MRSAPEPAEAPSLDRLSFETLISDTSAQLLHASPLTVGAAITTALCAIRTFFQADRCVLLAVKADTPFANVSAASYAEGVGLPTPTTSSA